MDIINVDKIKHLQTRIQDESKIFYRTDAIFEPLEGFRKLRLMIHVIRLICKLFVISGVITCVLGILAQMFYDDKHYLFVLGLISIFHIIGSPSGYYAFKTKNRYLLMTMFICNICWKFSIITFLIVYLLICKYHLFALVLLYQLAWSKSITCLNILSNCLLSSFCLLRWWKRFAFKEVL